MKKFTYAIVTSALLLSATAQATNFKSSLPRNDTQVMDKKGNKTPKEDFDLKLVPELAVDDNTLKPALSFITRSKSFFDKTYKDSTTPFFDTFFVFAFTANSGIDVGDFENPSESTDEIISEYVADGGNIEFDLSYRVSYNNWDFTAGTYYSLLSTDAVSTEKGTTNIINVDAEVYGFATHVTYNFNKVRLYAQYRTFDTSEDGQNADFTKILDDGDATEFGISLPLSVFSQASKEGEDDGFFLTLSRTKHSEVDKAIFRVSLQKLFEI